VVYHWGSSIRWEKIMSGQFYKAQLLRPAIGELLRHWRSIRGKSQLDLALDTGVSQKHVSFVETGRSSPSRQMVIDLSDALGVPLRDRNEIMLAAGYAPLYEQETRNEVPGEIDRALQRMLRQHEPFPAIVMDRYWNVIATNDAAPAFFGKFMDLESRRRPRNLLHLIFDPAGLQPYLVNFHETARSLLWRVKRESVGGIIDERTQKLLEELAAYPVAPADKPVGGAIHQDEKLPVIPIRFRANGTVLSMFSLISTVGTPRTIASEEIRLESMFPSNEAAETVFLEFMEHR
jgi:transcriptional regulator with XRE-family HTH domain